MIVTVFISISLIFIAIFLHNYNETRKLVEKKIETNAENLAHNKISQVEKVLISVKKIPENNARLLEKFSYSKTELVEILKIMVSDNPEIYGATIAFEPYPSNRGAKYIAPYVYKKNGKVIITSLANDNYNYHKSGWYRAPKQTGKAAWSEPYFDEGGGNVIMCTYSVPFYKYVKGKKVLMGIITADVSLEWLDDLVSSIKILKSGYGFLISSKGTIITHPVKEIIMHESIFGLAKRLKSPELAEIGQSMIDGKSGLAKITYIDITNGKLSWVYYSPISLSRWSLAVVYPIEELTAELDSLNRSILVIGSIGLAILLVVVIIISKSITRPLTKLATATNHFAKGEMDIELPVIKSHDEISNLNESFIYMRDELKKTIKELKMAYNEVWDSNKRLEEYNRTLEKRVNERTKEILIEARELTVLKSRFVSMISHEIRTPLYTISSSSEILELYENKITPGEKLEQFNRIQDAVDEIVEMLNDVISINKADIGKIELKFEEFDIIALGNHILGEVTLRYKKLPDILFTCKDEKLIIKSDKKELKQILSNLLSNAIKYTPVNKQVYFHITLDKKKLIIEVKDEGIGISDSDQENIFDPFTRGKNTGNISGTGLGLAITKRSVDILGGDILVKSKVGLGSLFLVKIPVEEDFKNTENKMIVNSN